MKIGSLSKLFAPQTITTPRTTKEPSAETSPSVAIDDAVSIAPTLRVTAEAARGSEIARDLGQANSERTDRLAKIKTQIQSGSYRQPDVQTLAKAVDRELFIS